MDHARETSLNKITPLRIGNKHANLLKKTEKITLLKLIYIKKSDHKALWSAIKGNPNSQGILN